MARTKLAQLRRELVNAEGVALLMSDTLATLKTRLRQLPDLLAPECGLTDAQAVRMLDLIDEALNGAADALEALTTDAAAS